ncbi:MAG TPA: CDP-alcohol phosphatidyltransferase family protein [Chitinispirillaceae bacterium]|nr:CDP-alcohol phosphatidyltransferase family protein [Chitinispirillaceae bacterium]
MKNRISFKMTWANRISIGRILLIPVFVFLLNECQKWSSFFQFLPLQVFIIAASLDVLDGYLARKNNEVTSLGSILDPLADKLLMITVLFIFVFRNKSLFYASIPPVLFYMVLLREIILILGAGILILFNKKLIVKPRFVGKVATFLQVLLIASVLAGFKQSVIFFLTVPACLFVFISLIFYILDGVRQIARKEGAAD